MFGFHSEITDPSGGEGKVRRVKKSSSNSGGGQNSMGGQQIYPQGGGGYTGASMGNQFLPPQPPIQFQQTPQQQRMARKSQRQTRSMSHSFGQQQSQQQPQAQWPGSGGMMLPQAQQLTPMQMMQGMQGMTGGSIGYAQPPLQQQQQPQQMYAPPQQQQLQIIQPSPEEIQKRLRDFKQKRAASKAAQKNTTLTVTASGGIVGVPDLDDGEDAFYTDDNPSDSPPAARAIDPEYADTKTTLSQSPPSQQQSKVDISGRTAYVSENRVHELIRDAFRVLDQHIQQIVVENNRIKSQSERLLVNFRSLQSNIDTKNQDTATRADLDALDETVRGERDEAFTAFENKIKQALKAISDQTYTMYAVVKETVSLFEEPSLSSKEKSLVDANTILQLSYPMQRTEEGVWMRARTVSSDGTISVSWVPVWAYPLGSKDRHIDNRIIYLGDFHTAAGSV